MNKKQAVKEIRDIILKYIFIEVEKMKGYNIRIDKNNDPVYADDPYLDFDLLDFDCDEIISIRIFTTSDNNSINIHNCPDSLYESICNYDNYKFNILDCR